MSYFSKVTLLFLCVAFITGCSAYKSNIPPSPYIGLYGTYNGYKNGNLPSENLTYSGEWRSPDGLLTGQYKNAIPYGTWVSYYENFMPHQIIKYYKNGFFNKITYFPDQMPQMQMEGKYTFAHKKYTCSATVQKFWDFEGNLITKTSTPDSKIFLHPQLVPAMPSSQETSIQNDSVQSYYTTNENMFTLAVYLISRTKSKLANRILIKGIIQPKNEVKILQNISRGDIHLSLVSCKIIDNALNFEFRVDNQPLNLNRISITLKLRRTNKDMGSNTKL